MQSLQILYSYWNEVRADRLAPQRLEIEPSRIAGILSQTFMLEWVDWGTYPYRLAGTRLCEMFGSELRGKNFLDGWSEEDRRVLEGHLAAICEQGAVAQLVLEGILDARRRIELEANLLPLYHAGKITRIIGAVSATQAPHWLGLEPLRSRRLKQHRLVWPDGRPAVGTIGTTGEPLSDQHAPGAPALPAPGARVLKADQPRLRVVEGGRASSTHDKP
jgi:hypothetical protein